MNPTVPPLKATQLGPTEAEQTVALEAFEQHALAQGVILEGRANHFTEGYHVTARRADTGERLPGLGFQATLHLANHPAEFMAALETLLAEAVAALVRI
jgi:hypothetical protein